MSTLNELSHLTLKKSLKAGRIIVLILPVRKTNLWEVENLFQASRDLNQGNVTLGCTLLFVLAWDAFVEAKWITIQMCSWQQIL